MGRWQPDARGRLARAAMELYASRGYEQTTVAEIAERAGVTERTFFRYFSDKREVLFDGSQALQEVMVANIATADASASPIDIVSSAVQSAAGVFDQPDFSRQRSVVIASNASLQERELLKLSTLGLAMAQALRDRGVPDPAAALAGDTGVTIFRIGFETWVGDASSGDLAQDMHDALTQLKGLTTDTP